MQTITHIEPCKPLSDSPKNKQASFCARSTVLKKLESQAQHAYTGQTTQKGDQTMLEYEQIQIDNPAFTVIWLHGLGASGHDFMPLVPQFHAAGIRANFIFPHAPVRPVTLNGGMQMRAWYDIYNLSSLDHEDVDGMQQAVASIHQMIEQQPENHPIVLAGFSQGGAVAIAAALNYPKPLAGLIALSTYPSTAKNWLCHHIKQPKDLAVFLAHGNWDAVLPLMLGQKTLTYLNEWGYQPTWHTYPMGHELCDAEVLHVQSFLADIRA